MELRAWLGFVAASDGRVRFGGGASLAGARRCGQGLAAPGPVYGWSWDGVGLGCFSGGGGGRAKVAREEKSHPNLAHSLIAAGAGAGFRWAGWLAWMASASA